MVIEPVLFYRKIDGSKEAANGPITLVIISSAKVDCLWGIPIGFEFMLESGNLVLGYRLSRFRVVNSIAVKLSKSNAVFVKDTIGTLICNDQPIDGNDAYNLG